MIAASANLGTANVAGVLAAGATTVASLDAGAGLVQTTGNVAAGNVVATKQFYGDGGGLSNVTVAGNAITGNVIISGNVVAGDGIFSGNVIATGNLNAADGNFAGNVTVAKRLSVTGNVVVAGNLNAADGNFTGNVALSKGISVTGNVVVAGNLNAVDGNFTGNVALSKGIAVAGNVIVTGNITAAEGKFAANVIAASANLGTANVAGVLAAGATTVASLNAGSGTIQTTGNVIVSGNINAADANLTGNLIVSKRISVAGNVDIAANQMLKWAPTVQNNMLMLYGAGTPTVASTDVYGFGVNGSIMRYNAPTSASHVWYVNNAETMRTNATAGVQSSRFWVVSGANTDYYMNFSGSNPIINFDGNDYLAYDRTNNTYGFYTGGVLKASIDNLGNVVAAGNLNAVDGNFTGNVALSKGIAVAGNVIVTGNVNAADANFTGNVALTKGITVAGNVVITGNVNATDANFAGNVALTKGITVTGNAIVTGNVTAIDGIFSANVQAASANLGTANVAGILVAGATTVASLNAGSGTIQTTGNVIVTGNLTAAEGKFAANVIAASANLGTANVAGILVAGATTVASLNAGSGTIQTTGNVIVSGNITAAEGRFAANVIALAANLGTANVAGVLRAGALTVASVNAGSGAITTTGTVTGSKLACDTDFYMGSPSLFTDPIINFDGFDFIKYLRSTNIFEFVIGNFRKASIDSNGNLGVTGNITAADANLTGNVVVSKRLSVTGNATVTGMSTLTGGIVFGGGARGDGENTALTLDAAGLSRLGFVKKAGFDPMIASGNGKSIIFGRSNDANVANLVAATTLTESMRIDTNGNVGINTAAPLAALHVAGNVIVTGNVTVAGSANFNGNVAMGTGRTVGWGTTTVQNNILTLNGSNGPTDTNVYGLGVNSFVMRYNAPAGASHIWYVNNAETMRTNATIGVQSSRFTVDATCYLTLSSTNPVLAFDGNDYMSYDRTNNRLNFVVGANVVAFVDETAMRAARGLNVTGNVAAVNGTFSGSFAAQSTPAAVGAGTYAVAVTDFSLRFSNTCTVTLPAPATFPGRVLYLSTVTANAVTSASSIVVPLGSNAPGTAILTAAAGKFAMLQSNSVSWLVLMAN